MKYSKTFAEALEDVRKPKVVKEEDDHEVSMAVGQVRVMKERLDTIKSKITAGRMVLDVRQYSLDSNIRDHVREHHECIE